MATVRGSLVGQIARILPEKGFGFIRTTDGQEYFFHRSEIDRPLATLKDRQRVRFLPQDTPKGLRAANCEVIEDGNSET